MNYIVINPDSIILNDKVIDIDHNSGISMLLHIYKSRNLSYPKFYKMDHLSQLGYIAAQLLLENQNISTYDAMAIVAVGRSGSLATDIQYHKTIETEQDYFPSPALFVYTLANIVTGEIAIRHKIYGETSSFLIEDYDANLITTLLLTSFQDNEIETVTGGWIEWVDESHFSLRFITADRSTPHDDITEFFTKYNL